MTDYELASLLIVTVDSLWQIFAIYVSIVFAFLIAAYVVSSKLAPKIVSIVITLYTLVALWSLFGLNRTSIATSSLAREMKRRALDPDSSLGWHPAATTPELVFESIPTLITALALIAYVGSIIFFLHQRKESALS